MILAIVAIACGRQWTPPQETDAVFDPAEIWPDARQVPTIELTRDAFNVPTLDPLDDQRRTEDPTGQWLLTTQGEISIDDGVRRPDFRPPSGLTILRMWRVADAVVAVGFDQDSCRLCYELFGIDANGSIRWRRLYSDLFAWYPTSCADVVFGYEGGIDVNTGELRYPMAEGWWPYDKWAVGDGALYRIGTPTPEHAYTTDTLQRMDCATGAVDWEIPLGFAFGGDELFVTIGSDPVVIVEDYLEQRVYDARDGSQRFAIQEPEESLTSGGDGRLYSRSGAFAVDALTGSRLWTADDNNDVYRFRGPATFLDGYVVVGGESYQRTVTIGRDSATGEVLWWSDDAYVYAPFLSGRWLVAASNPRGSLGTTSPLYAIDRAELP